LRDVLVRVTNDYGRIPLYVTENGAAFSDEVHGGRIKDVDRMRYIEDHIVSCSRAIEEGADLRGYFVWSLMDNFEWAEGYSKRFGIVWIDYDTQERVLKDSAHWYRDFIAAQATVGAL
jgi:beta-glucosidase